MPWKVGNGRHQVRDSFEVDIRMAGVDVPIDARLRALGLVQRPANSHETDFFGIIPRFQYSKSV